MATTMCRMNTGLSRRSDTTRLAGPSRRLVVAARAASGNSVVAPGDLVLVAGAGGGVGQLLTAKLLERGFRVRAVDRGSGKVERLFDGKAEVVKADLRDVSQLGPSMMDGVAAVCCCTGTTAFPSKRWDGNNGPKPTDWIATSNLINATPKTIKRFVFVTSAGVERQEQFPWAILNLFGVLKYKRDAEVYLEKSGLPYSILRPSRLTDGPYTSYDLNTLLKATSGSRQDVVLSPRDDLLGEASRIAVAEAALQCLLLPSTANRKYAISSTEGEGPAQDTDKWQALFTAAN